MSGPRESIHIYKSWDDKCALRCVYRAIFSCDRDGSLPSVSAISLANLEEIVLWAQFIGYDLKTLQPEDAAKSVQLCEVLFLLGASSESSNDAQNGDSDDSTIATLRLAPGASAKAQTHT